MSNNDNRPRNDSNDDNDDDNKDEEKKIEQFSTPTLTEEEQEEELQGIATRLCAEWTSNKMQSCFGETQSKLDYICIRFLWCWFNGLKKGAKSIYLTNPEMKATLKGFPDWKSYIPTSDISLHKKFKCNAFILYHFITKYDDYTENKDNYKHIDAKLKKVSKGKYPTIESIFENGMCMLSIIHIFFVLQKIYCIF